MMWPLEKAIVYQPIAISVASVQTTVNVDVFDV